MQVRDLMTADPITTRAEASVLEARQLMMDKHIRHLLITEGSKLLGMVTDRDIRLTLPSPAPSLSVWEISYRLAGLVVAAVMTKSIVSPRQDAREAALLMLDHKIGALPVVDGETDLLRAFVKMS